MKLLSILFSFLFIFGSLVACSQQDADSTDTSLKDVETVITEQGFELEKVDLPSDNVFIQELNGIVPEVYNLEDNTFSVYVFPTASDRGKGIQRFEELTATAELIKHKAFGINNILVFYVSDNESIQNRVFEALQNLDSPK